MLRIRNQFQEAFDPAPQEFSTVVPHKSVPQEFPTRVSPARSITQDCPTRVSDNVWPFVFECVCAFGFVGSMLFCFPSPPAVLPQCFGHKDPKGQPPCMLLLLLLLLIRKHK